MHDIHRYTPLPIKPASDTEVVFVYGAYEAHDNLRTWLKKDPKRRLIFLEDDQERLGIFLSQLETERFLLHSQVQVVPLSDPMDVTLREVIFSYLFRSTECFVIPGKNPAFHSFFSLLLKNCKMEIARYKDYGLLPMQNVLQNLKQTQTLYLGKQFANGFQGFPAIICGAGPSLEKNIKVLKTLGDKAFIFVGGSALTLDELKSLPFYFGAALDPTHGQFSSLSSFAHPFFYQNQVASDLLGCVKGERVLLGDQGGFPLEQHLTNELGLPLSSFDAGTHVGTFMVHIAHMLGCSPIILVGMDGCTQDGAVYYSGAKKGSSLRSDPIKTTNRQGKTVQTRDDFILGHAWLNHFQLTHEKTLLINATEGGKSIEGITHLSLEEVKEKWLKKTFDPQILWEKCKKQAKPYSLSTPSFHELKESIQNSQALLKKWLQSFQNQTHAFAKEPTLLSRELFYNLVLLPLWERWRFLIQPEEVIQQMEAPNLEKTVQQILFFLDVCQHYQKGGI